MATFGLNRKRTNVWWDFENVPVPRDLRVEYVVERIIHSLHLKGFLGPVKIRAIIANGEKMISYGLRRKMAGVSFRNLNLKDPEKNAADIEIKDEIENWCIENPENDENVLIITGDKGFVESFVLAREHGHTVLGVCRSENGVGLRFYAEDLWIWREFLLLPKEAAEYRTIRGLGTLAKQRKEVRIERLMSLEEEEARRKAREEAFEEAREETLQKQRKDALKEAHRKERKEARKLEPAKRIRRHLVDMFDEVERGTLGQVRKSNKKSRKQERRERKKMEEATRNQERREEVEEATRDQKRKRV